jgi:hypothetical protein
MGKVFLGELYFPLVASFGGRTKDPKNNNKMINRNLLQELTLQIPTKPLRTLKQTSETTARPP